ncbi:hypothetical protein BTJ39_14940 [Izhakiella australiensis]|uniref:Uncharacterized protein n=1 Tax=Izhakiella australiensis TaxID=1926881 RepID=A0A1S8YK09_9GAMM|nr:hypothetical protein BTJ39_14940 [Izhakiella australiensis]
MKNICVFLIFPETISGAISCKKGSIFHIDFSIILRPHVTTKFFSQNFAAPATLPEGVGLLDKMVV